MTYEPQVRVRFGNFELDLQSGELFSIEAGSERQKILLREQTFRVLKMLIDFRGAIVSREEIKKTLWPDDTEVDFDHSINVTIGTLRRSLGDSAGQPKYIETVARRGYRLMIATEMIPMGGAIAKDVKDDAPGYPSHDIAPGSEGYSLIGRKVAHYRILQVLGGGGMGVVYKAEDLKLGRHAALKFLPEELLGDPTSLQRFRHEARVASSLNHPNICTIYSVEECAGQPFLAMELLEGETLRDRMAGSAAGQLTMAAVVTLAIQICDGLQAAGDRGIIHRDIKPANIFLTKQGAPKILDFGLAKFVVERGKTEIELVLEHRVRSRYPSDLQTLETDLSLTRTDLMLGTAAYMSPEQIRKEELDARSDLFSFGLVLYEMTTGRRAFEGATAEAVHMATLTRTPKPVREINPAAPAGLEHIINIALAKEREQRYQTPAQMRADLESLAVDEAKISAISFADDESSQATGGAARSHLRQVKTSAWIAALVLVLVVFGTIFWQRRSPPPASREPKHLATGFEPALSRDGKLVAYVSTVGAKSVPHIWVRQTAGGAAFPLTGGTDVDTAPNFSPDATLIAFYSDRDGGGLYVTPTLQDKARLVTHCNFCTPHFSPSGDRILFRDNHGAFTVPVEGSTPTPLPLNRGFTLEGPIYWAPDGERILFYGFRNNQTAREYHWWVGSLNGREPAPLNVPGLDENPASPASVRDWVRARDGREWIFYSQSGANGWRLFRVEVTPEGKPKGDPEELSNGTGLINGGSGSQDGRFMYVSSVFTESIFEIPTTPEGVRTGPIVQLHVSEESDDRSPYVSHDGRWMIYDVSGGGRANSIFLRDLVNETDRSIDDRGRRPSEGGDTSISPDGSTVMFGRDCERGTWSRPGGGQPVPCGFLIHRDGGEPRQVCNSCTARGFSSDGATVLLQKYELSPDAFFTGKTTIASLDLKTGAEKDFLVSSEGSLYHPFFSWDDRWVSFKRKQSIGSISNKAQILIAAVHNGFAAEESRWIQVTDGQYSDDKPQFSPDGKMLYFTSTRDGYLCIWRQRLDPATKKPIGRATAFEHFHNSMGHEGASIVNPTPADLSVAYDKVLFSLPQQRSDIWQLQVE